MGRPFADLLHEEDREALQPILDMSEPFWQTRPGVQHMFVVRMKTTMASTVRSQAKVQYKVCVRASVRVCMGVGPSLHLCTCSVWCNASTLSPPDTVSPRDVRCRM